MNRGSVIKNLGLRYIATGQRIRSDHWNLVECYPLTGGPRSFVAASITKPSALKAFQVCDKQFTRQMREWGVAI